MKEIMNQKQAYFNANHRTITTDNGTLSALVECCEKSVKSDRLPNLNLGGSIEGTTTKNGHRTRQTCGIFLPQIYLSNGYAPKWADLSKAVFVARLICGDKPSNRTNNASRFFAVVETLLHPLGNGNSYLLNKEKIKMLFKFLLLGEKRLTVRIRAKSEAEARQCLNLSKSTAICIARFSDNPTACSAHSLHETGKPCPKDAIFLARNGQPTEQKNILHPFAKIGYSALVVAKSTASRRKLNDLPLANTSTPLTRAFFVRSLRSPKENTNPKTGERSFLSMVGRIGQRLGVGCLPVVAVSYPDTLYRPAVGSQAVDTQKSTTGAITMFYKFLFTGSRLRITVFARNLAEAYTRLPLSQTKPVLIACLPVQGGIYA